MWVFAASVRLLVQRSTLPVIRDDHRNEMMSTWRFIAHTRVIDQAMARWCLSTNFKEKTL
jgi:hypothetical protein